MTLVQRWLMFFRLEHRVVTLQALRVEIEFAARWLEKARAYAAQREREIESLRRDLEAADAMLSLDRRSR